MSVIIPPRISRPSIRSDIPAYFFGIVPTGQYVRTLTGQASANIGGLAARVKDEGIAQPGSRISSKRSAYAAACRKIMEAWFAAVPHTMASKFTNKADAEKDSLCRILSLDGGGAKGFYTLGVLKEIEGITGRPLHQCFDLVFGTSTGAIIGTLIALGYRVDQIHALYQNTCRPSCVERPGVAKLARSRPLPIKSSATENSTRSKPISESSRPTGSSSGP